MELGCSNPFSGDKRVLSEPDVPDADSGLTTSLLWAFQSAFLAFTRAIRSCKAFSALLQSHIERPFFTRTTPCVHCEDISFERVNAFQ